MSDMKQFAVAFHDDSDPGKTQWAGAASVLETPADAASSQEHSWYLKT